VKRFTADSSGATAIEYTLLVMLIAIVVVAAISTIGTNVNSMIQSAANGFN
jgi:pilus assembly protein Flp/PilA